MDDKKMATLEKLIRRFESSGLQSLEVSTKDLNVKMSKPQPILQQSKQAPTQTTDTTSTASKPHNRSIKSPMVGSIFLAASPDSKPFIQNGQKVDKGSTLCLIEAMKTFTPIIAEEDLTISEILVENGQAVEFNQDLIAIEA